MAKKIKVRPSRPDLIVLDDLNRRIPYKADGHPIARTTLISRSIKCGDLIWVDRPEPVESEKVPQQKKPSNKKSKEG